MPDTAESHSNQLPTNRSCTMEITNNTTEYCLVDPRVYMEGGFPFSPPTPTVRCGHREICSFIKDDNTATGAVGVVTYDVFSTTARSSSFCIAVMFSVPFDYNWYHNYIGLGVFDKATPCDKHLYEKMYEEKLDGKDGGTNFVRQKADGSGVSFKDKDKKLELRACMSDEGQAMIKLQLFH